MTTRAVRRPVTWAAVLTAVGTYLGVHVGAIELLVRMVGVVLLAVAVGSYDWRAGLAVAGVALILATIDLPRPRHLP